MSTNNQAATLLPITPSQPPFDLVRAIIPLPNLNNTGQRREKRLNRPGNNSQRDERRIYLPPKKISPSPSCPL
ncbi:hypothetical protein TMatcc_001110 [Talaromyces marneffei ATCC 18224]